ncbi:AAA family ATPase [Paenibacillus sediminis]|uniref:DNA polymerase III delta prime subunit n=1 Tax=Paenibacillus sediminis TaxID=664909 RepID=A0ABS4H7T6_9BACL|nr:AAA family ATPase [Paenibacillus sediminis]MBP1938526.1 DNA polymerase III delta prime subunit [Paenibacillus sediminis]
MPSIITSDVQLPFDQYKWIFATLQAKEVLKSPRIWLRVLRTMNLYDGLEYGLTVADGQQFHADLEALGLTNDVGAPLTFVSGNPQRSFLRGYQTYWTNTCVIKPPALINNIISLTPLGKSLSTGKMNFEEYVKYIVKKFQLPNIITQYTNLQEWYDNNKQIKPFAIILEVLCELYTQAGFKYAYLTESETAVLVYPLSGSMTISEIANEIIMWRNNDPSFNINFLYYHAFSVDNEYRSIKEFLQVLSAGNLLISTQLMVQNFDINRNNKLISVQEETTCYFLNCFVELKWSQLGVDNNQINSIRELCEQAYTSGYYSFISTNSESQNKLDFVNYFNDQVQITSYPTIAQNFEPEIDNFIDILKQNKQIILSGPPGTGKTRTALQITEKLQQNNELAHREIVLFHQATSYEDFIEGIRPNIHSQQLNYTYKQGIFKTICERAKTNPGQYFAVIIDEINRGNISNIFGELIFLLEPSYRKPEYAVQLQYTNDLFYVPDNVLIIGTMNSSDKSAIDLDLALRRRFNIIHLPPNSNALNDRLTTEHVTITSNDGTPINLGDVLDKLNNFIFDNNGLGKDFGIGHAFFMPISGVQYNLPFLMRTWNYKVIPLLNEFIQLSPSFRSILNDHGFNIHNGVVEHFSNEDVMLEMMKQLNQLV